MRSNVRLKRRRLVEELAKRKISQNAWAGRFGVSKAYLSQLLNGQRRYPGALLRRRMLHALDLSFEELFVVEQTPVREGGLPSRGLEEQSDPTDLLFQLRLRSLKLKLEKKPNPQPERGLSVDHILRDLRYAARGLRRNPTFSLVAIATLALAIGANTTLFSAIETVLLSPPPFPEPDQLVRVWTSNPSAGWFRGAISPQNALDLAIRNRTFQGMGTFTMRSGNLLTAGRPLSVELALVTPSLLEALAVPPARGRLFVTEENAPGADNVVLISDRLWSGAFGRSSDIVGRTVTLDERRLTVAGVMPDHFRFPTAQTDLWKPYGMGPDDGGPRGSSWVYAIGRLSAGTSIEQAQADVENIARDLAAEYPDANRDRSVFLETLHAAETGPVRSALLMLWGAVGLILLIACVNVANLLLARAASRRREFSVRSVLGAGPGRVLQQLLLECLLLASLSAAAGLLLAVAGNRLLVWLAEGRLPRAELIALNGRVALFAVALTLLTTLLFGLAPALHGSRLRLADALRDRSEGSRARLRFALVAAQVCLALVLLSGAGLLIRSFDSLLSVELGFNPERLYTFRVEPPMRSSSTGKTMEEFMAKFEQERATAGAFYDDLMGRLGRIPGVSGVGAINRRPLGGNMWQTRVAVEGRPVESPRDRAPATARNVTRGYFASMEIPLLRGRLFSTADRGRAPLATVINRAMAETYWPGENPVGSRITFMDPPPSDYFWMEVVGVVDDVRHINLAVDPIPVFYVPVEQAYFGFFGDWGMDVMLRTSADVARLAVQVDGAVGEVNPELPVSSFQSMDEVIGENASSQRFNLLLLGLFASLAVVLASVGIYGVIAYLAAQRRQEFGIRTALGARPNDVVRLVVLQSIGVTLLGVAGGVIASLLLSGSIADLLYEVSPTDPLTLTAMAVLMSAIGIGAGLLPAWRAGKADPLTALRAD